MGNDCFWSTDLVGETLGVTEEGGWGLVFSLQKKHKQMFYGHNTSK